MEGGKFVQIMLNGKSVEFDSEVNLLDFLEMRGIEPNRVVVEYNGDIAKREDWRSITLKDNDRLEILKFVGGG